MEILTHASLLPYTESKESAVTMILSGCLIVKNEEKHLERCLKSLVNKVDEIVVVDTGSTDKTKEIAREYTEKVFEYEWKNDFAAARNYSLEKATGDWILVIDADEELVSPREALEKVALQYTDRPVVYLVQINSVNDADGSYTRSYTTRFFPNAPSIRFHYPIHELVKDSEERAIQSKTDKIVLYHYGYGSKREAKFRRNIEILKSLKNDSGKYDEQILFYLIMSYNSIGEYAKALKYYITWEKEYLERSPEPSAFLSQYLETMLQLNRCDEALEHIIPYVLRSWHNPDFCLKLAECFKKEKQYQKAIEYADRALSFDPRRLMLYDEKDIQLRAHLLLSEVYMNTYEFTRSLDHLKKAYETSPGAILCQKIIDLAFELKDIDTLEYYLEEIKKYESYHNERNDVLYANVLFNKGEIRESVREFMKLKDGKQYIDQLIGGLASAQRFTDIKVIQETIRSL